MTDNILLTRFTIIIHRKGAEFNTFCLLLLLMSISGRRASIKPLIKARFGNDVHPLAYYSNRSSIVITFVKTPLYSLCFNPNVVIKVLYIDIFGDTNSLIRSGLLRRTL